MKNYMLLAAIVCSLGSMSAATEEPTKSVESKKTIELPVQLQNEGVEAKNEEALKAEIVKVISEVAEDIEKAVVASVEAEELKAAALEDSTNA